jgi:hypothetical protein
MTDTVCHARGVAPRGRRMATWRGTQRRLSSAERHRSGAGMDPEPVDLSTVARRILDPAHAATGCRQ